MSGSEKEERCRSSRSRSGFVFKFDDGRSVVRGSSVPGSVLGLAVSGRRRRLIPKHSLYGVRILISGRARLIVKSKSPYDCCLFVVVVTLQTKHLFTIANNTLAFSKPFFCVVLYRALFVSVVCVGQRATIKV
jgi:hypothetical protein